MLAGSWLTKEIFVSIYRVYQKKSPLGNIKTIENTVLCGDFFYIPYIHTFTHLCTLESFKAGVADYFNSLGKMTPPVKIN